MGCNKETLLLGATTKTMPDRQALQQQRLRLQNAEKIMTSLTMTTLNFNQLQLKPLVCMVSPPPVF